jgi:hypothetical protein
VGGVKDLTLDVEEAVPLGHALLARLAHDLGIRALAVKGPVLAMQGLRAAKTSADIDVLVEPAGLDRLCAALGDLDWRLAEVVETPHIVPFHSVNLSHPRWPVEIDLHHWFPGFLAAPDEVFDLLWSRRVNASLAHQECPAPDMVAHTALMALHYLRDATTAWGAAGIDVLADVVDGWDPQQKEDLAQVAARAGAARPLAPLLHRVGAPELADVAVLAVPVQDWELQTQSATKEVLPWLVGWSRTPWSRRPAYLRRALWIDKEHFQPEHGPRLSRAQVRRARVARLRRGSRALPVALREYVRRDRTRDA